MKLKKKLSNKARQQIALLTQKAMRAYLNSSLSHAEQHCREILARDAANADACNLLGKIAERQGEPDKARDIYLHSHRHHQNHPPLLASLALLHGRLGEHELAIQYWQSFVKINSASPEGWQALSGEYGILEQWEMAESAAIKSLKLAPDRAALHSNLGNILLKLRRHSEAIPYLRKSAELLPDDAEACFHLARALLDSGAMDEAFELFQQTLRLNPDYIDALLMLLRFRKATSYDDIIKHAESILDNPAATPNQRAVLSFGLGKAWEDLNDFDKSFFHYAEGNRIRRKLTDFSIEDEQRKAELTKTLFTAELFAEDRTIGCNGDEFLFIVGLPRCGSTLLAKILSAHTRVIDAGETDTLYDTIALLTSGDCDKIDLQSIVNLDQSQLDNAAAQYRTMMQRFYGNSEIYVDKTLPNFWLVGFIRLMFPGAKIVHCTRNPMDHCFSIFSNDFEGSLLKYTNNIEDIARYYQLYLDLAEHWRTTLPAEKYHEISYESLIAAPEEISRSLLAFCNLEWDDACLNYHTSKSTVHTSSLAQVRQPIYKSSIERWKRYEKHLQPLIEALGDAAKYKQNK